MIANLAALFEASHAYLLRCIWRSYDTNLFDYFRVLLSFVFKRMHILLFGVFAFEGALRMGMDFSYGIRHDAFTTDMFARDARAQVWTWDMGAIGI